MRKVAVVLLLTSLAVPAVADASERTRRDPLGDVRVEDRNPNNWRIDIRRVKVEYGPKLAPGFSKFVRITVTIRDIRRYVKDNYNTLQYVSVNFRTTKGDYQYAHACNNPNNARCSTGMNPDKNKVVFLQKVRDESAGVYDIDVSSGSGSSRAPADAYDGVEMPRVVRRG